MAKSVCVVGAGRWGKNHIRTLDQLGCLGGVVEKCPERRKQLEQDYPKAKIFADLQDALRDSFDGFTVATPAETHFAIGSAIIKSNKHVLIEKPLALSAGEAAQLDRLATDRGVNLMVGHVLLFHPAIRKVKELIESDKIGKLQYLYSNRLNLGTVRKEENILWSFAPHDISIFQYFTESLPEEVVSRGGAFVQPHIHDSTMTILQYPDNITAHIFVSWLHPFKEHRLLVIGSKGMLSFEDSGDKELLFYEKGIDWVNGEPIKRDGATEKIAYDQAMPLTEELQYFVSRLDGAPVEVANGRNGVEVLGILERATNSLIGTDEVLAAPAAKKHGAADKDRDYFAHESSYVDENVSVGKGTKVWHFSHIQSNSSLGEGCSIGQNVNVANNVKIGNFVKIQNNVSIYEGVELEDYVFCGPSMVFTNVLDPRSKYPQRGGDFYVKTLVREGASIGANATIVCGHTIGRHAFIAAGAVVTSDVPDFALMMGVPARQKGWVCECGEILPEVKDSVECPRCEIGYTLDGNVLLQAEERKLSAAS